MLVWIVVVRRRWLRACIVKKIDLTGEQEIVQMEFLYRGVHFGHPARAAALNGVVVPGDINGTVSPEQHNRGGWSAVSPYTSWTPSEALAKTYACSVKGPGTLLRVRTHCSRTNGAGCVRLTTTTKTKSYFTELD
jgi:hypothetical protein